ncbi:TPA: hypothetical protein HA239_01645 [Candidatus Woesearchaeota archaeon]|nr:hypothetical protein QT06_C0001G0929 [archaeon GW2011_AR15]MBS3104590.1 hypothetical protein [Candidatus Woesearchaeota archaeon]HIH41095.1 hypothetical protein [Candidatus Woesearchaeota archaeon]
MTIWTPKHPGGVRTQWAPPPEDTSWTEGNLLVYSTQIKQVRIVHLENIYRFMHHWLTEEGWTSIHSVGDRKWIEDFYGEYRDQQGHKEIRWWWRLRNNHGGIAGEHPFFRYRWDIDVLTTNMKRVEIMYKGKKIKPYVGEFLMWFNSILEIDINGWFNDNSKFALGKVLHEYFLRMIYKDRFREQEIELRRRAERFVEDLKFYLELNRVSEARKRMSEEKQWF